MELSVPLDDIEYELARNQVPTAFLARSRDEWLGLFGPADVAAMPVQRPGEMFDHPQVLFAEMEMRIADESHGHLRQMRPGIRFHQADVPDPLPAPRVGQHDEILDEMIAVAVSPVEHGSTDLAHALTGIRVVDFSQYFAGRSTSPDVGRCGPGRGSSEDGNGSAVGFQTSVIVASALTRANLYIRLLLFVR
jgi:CoA-transferase family III